MMMTSSYQNRDYARRAPSFLSLAVVNIGFRLPEFRILQRASKAGFAAITKIIT